MTDVLPRSGDPGEDGPAGDLLADALPDEGEPAPDSVEPAAVRAAAPTGGALGVLRMVFPDWTIIGITLAAMTIRFIHMFTVRWGAEKGFDAVDYLETLSKVVDGHGFVDTWALRERGIEQAGMLHPPGFVLFLAGPAKLGLSDTQLQIWIALVSALVIPLVALAARTIAGRRAGIVAALMAAVAPPLLINSGLVMPEAPFQVLIAAGVCAGVLAWDRPTPARLATSGAMFGLASLVRLEAVVLLAIWVVAVAVVGLRRSSTASIPARLGPAGLVAMAGLVVLAPFTVANMRAFGPTQWTGTGSSLSIYAGCNFSAVGPDANPYSSVPSRRPTRLGDEQIDAGTTAALMTAQARRFCAEHLSDVIAAVPARIATPFGLLGTWGASFESLRNDSPPMAFPTMILHIVCVPLGIVGWVRHRRRAPLVLGVAPLLAGLALAASTFGNPRYLAAADIAAIIGLAILAFAVVPDTQDEDRWTVASVPTPATWRTMAVLGLLWLPLFAYALSPWYLPTGTRVADPLRQQQADLADARPELAPQGRTIDGIRGTLVTGEQYELRTGEALVPQGTRKCWLDAWGRPITSDAPDEEVAAFIGTGVQACGLETQWYTPGADIDCLETVIAGLSPELVPVLLDNPGWSGCPTQ